MEDHSDGVRDYFNSMHAYKFDEHGYDRIELGISVPKVFRCDGNSSSNSSESNIKRLQYISNMIIMEEIDSLLGRKGC